MNGSYTISVCVCVCMSMRLRVGDLFDPFLARNGRRPAVDVSCNTYSTRSRPV